jgi:hypothetical protein
MTAPEYPEHVLAELRDLVARAAQAPGTAVAIPRSLSEALWAPLRIDLARELEQVRVTQRRFWPCRVD